MPSNSHLGGSTPRDRYHHLLQRLPPPRRLYRRQCRASGLLSRGSDVSRDAHWRAPAEDRASRLRRAHPDRSRDGAPARDHPSHRGAPEPAPQPQAPARRHRSRNEERLDDRLPTRLARNARPHASGPRAGSEVHQKIRLRPRLQLVLTRLFLQCRGAPC